VTTFSYFTPLLSTLIGAAYLGVRPGGGLWLGGVTLVVAAFACGGATRTEAAVPDVRPPVHQGG
jgi:drug/metabolite transporter (DMT)-like permease